MSVRVITPPAPIVTPGDIAGTHASTDAKVAALIQAVTEEIDGPTGWLGRALGPQTLELTLSGFCRGRNFSLPCRPIIGFVSVKYLDSNGDEQTIPSTDYHLADNRVWFSRGLVFPATIDRPDAVRIRYKAGYNGTSGAAVGEEQTGPVPESARQAIILNVQHLKAVGTENLFLRSETVEGVGSFQYTVTDQAGEVIRKSSERLLRGLVVPSA